ncbi:ABC transporter ATP-binding protein [Curtobacterium sp. NPDC090223]|uniref:ABC transporter ATP-binding protein n=2 Tax=unclassified Curtobacterium TaxID=257496 RepID=UPI0038206F7F
MRSSASAISVTGLEHDVGGRQLFRAFEMEVPPGSIHGIAGASGIGKSTLLRMIGGLERPSAGSIRVFEHDVTTFGRAALRRYLRHDVGFVFQDAGLVEAWTVRRNLAAAASAGPRTPTSVPLSVEGAADRLGLPRVLLDRGVMELSGGERQRVAIACVLVRMPRLVLLDEPTAALDAQRTGLVAQLARELADDGATVILATHDLELLDRADSQTLLTEPSTFHVI